MKNNEMTLVEIIEPVSTLFPVGTTAWFRPKEGSNEFILLSVDGKHSQEFHKDYLASIQKKDPGLAGNEKSLSI